MAGPASENRVLREGVAVAAGQAVASIARLIGLRLVTDLVLPEVYAEVVLLVGLAILGTNLFCGPILQAAIRFYPDARRDRRAASLRALTTQLLVRRTASIGLLLPLAGAAWIAFFDPDVRLSGFVAVAVYLVLEVVRQYELSLLSAARRQTEHALWFAADGCLRPALAVTMILALGPTPLSILLGYALAIGLVNLALRRTTVRGEGAPGASASDDWSRGARGDLLAYARPLVPLALVAWVLQLSDRYILAGLAGADQAGIYAAAYSLASMPFVVGTTSIELLLRPILNDAVTHGDRARERRTVGLWLLLVTGSLLGVAGLLVALAEPIVGLALGEGFREGATLLPWIGAAHVVYGIQHVFESMIYSQRRTRLLVVMHSAAGATAVAACFLLIPSLGATGAAIATLLAMIVSLLVGAAISGFVPRILLGRASEA